MSSNIHLSPRVNSRDGHAPAVAEDRLVVDRCVAGEAGAWDELYQRQHDGLCESIKSMFGARRGDPEVIEEIAARVWFRIVTHDAALLDRFDPGRGCRLSTFLAAVAKREVAEFVRSERRRRRREYVACRPEMQAGELWEPWPTADWPGFVESLTPRERQFLVEDLLSPGDLSAQRMTAVNRWQLSRRIRGKLCRFLDGGAKCPPPAHEISHRRCQDLPLGG
jgi:DNA-directed RNA polymerase specialized sigma24 family protein